jgi:prepilin-type N-terminal cleavage/methylation domain-containing protein
MTNRHSGFSLIEALVALLVVLLGLTGAARLQASLIAASAQAKASDEATAFALDKLAEFQSIARYPIYQDELVSGTLSRQGLLHRYSISWQVEHSPDPDYKQVAIQVSWPAQSIEIQTLIPGLEPGRVARQQLQP